LKEALNNAVKHSHASEVWLRLKLDSRSFTLIVEDNGRGFQGRNGETSTASAERLYSGSGLVNLKKRLEVIGGRCVVQSSSGQGTKVEMTVFTHAAVSPVVAIGPNAPREYNASA